MLFGISISEPKFVKLIKKQTYSTQLHLCKIRSAVIPHNTSCPHGIHLASLAKYYVCTLAQGELYYVSVCLQYLCVFTLTKS